MIIELTNVTELVLLAGAVAVAKRKILPFSLLITCFFILSMYSHHQAKIDEMDANTAINWMTYNIYLGKYFFTESIVIFFLAVCVWFVNVPLSFAASIVLFLNGIFTSACGIFITNDILISYHYYAQYFFVILIIAIAWISAIDSRMDS